MLGLCVTVVDARQQSTSVTISIVNNSTLRVQIELASPGNRWSFRNAFAGALGLGERIEQFQASRSNEPVRVKRLAPGEFLAASEVDMLSYEAHIPPRDTADIAHLSWLTADCGVLMLADLLPEAITAGSIAFDLSDGWSARSSEACDKTHRCSFDDPVRQVYLVARGLRATSTATHGIEVSAVVYGDWPVRDKSVLTSATRVLQWYVGFTNFRLRDKPTIILAPMPFSDSNAQWKAETRGATVVLLINPRASFRNFLGQISIIFTHEMFHLWVPNSLALQGDYDWFFEGFTSYIALQTALKLKLIGFQEYLNTLERVYNSYLSYADGQTLIEASARRWTSSTPVVYDKGMLAAFVYDVFVRRETRGQSSLSDIYRSLFARHADEPANANDVIIKLLTSSPATEGFSTTYIESRNRIQLEKVLPSFGFEISTEGSSSHLTIRKQLDQEQKNLMQGLGYRN
ncbi:MAG TPA: hypothetical protein VJ372_21530 [Pyrinomonadaceae bacterium]|jgi:Predicted protease with the C-terminal PDZ domain|nr:hypothetical protein [Pyrinomonadaceae bacterium]